MTTTATTDLVPAGTTWGVDPLHSHANFEIEHGGISIFRGGFKPIDAKLVAGEGGITLEGSVSVEGISVDDDQIRPHLLSPDFFDAERNPDISFRSTEVTGTADDLRVVGELTMAGVTNAVEARGKLRGPVPYGEAQKLALSLSTTIDRTEWGIDWQMELPGGQPALGNEVRLSVELEFQSE